LIFPILAHYKYQDMQTLNCDIIYIVVSKHSVFITINMFTLQKPLPAQNLNRSSGVEALLGQELLERLHGEGSAALRASRLVDTREPDLPASANSTGASLEANVASSSSEDEVTVIVDLEGAALLVLADGLDTGGVADVAHAHAAAVDVQLERGVVGIDVDAASVLVEPEGGVVDAGGDVLAVVVKGTGLVVLVGRVDDEAAILGLDVAILDFGTSAQRQQTEDVLGAGAREGSGLGKGKGDGGQGGNGGGGGELHVDGLRWCC